MPFASAGPRIPNVAAIPGVYLAMELSGAMTMDAVKTASVAQAASGRVYDLRLGADGKDQLPGRMTRGLHLHGDTWMRGTWKTRLGSVYTRAPR